VYNKPENNCIYSLSDYFKGTKLTFVLFRNALDGSMQPPSLQCMYLNKNLQFAQFNLWMIYHSAISL